MSSLNDLLERIAKRDDVASSERLQQSMISSLHRLLSNAINFRLGEESLEQISKWSKELSKRLESADDAFLFFQPRLHIIAERVVRSEKRLCARRSNKIREATQDIAKQVVRSEEKQYARRSNKISEVAQGIYFFVERRVQSTENELWEKSKAAQDKSIIELSFQILEAELLFLERTSPNSPERKLILATRDFLRGFLDEEDAPQKVAVARYGVSGHRIRKFREKLASWALILLRGSKDGAPSGQSANDYLKYLKSNLHGDRSDWYAFRDNLIEIETEFLTQGERVVDLAREISEQSGFFGDQILMELWSVRMKFIANLRYGADPDRNTADDKNAWLKEHLEW